METRSRLRSDLTRLISALVIAGCVAAVSAQSTGWNVATGDVRVLCPLTIGGSFEAKTRMLTGSLRAGDPFVGELAVDLTALDTGISLRNQHLRDSYLEVGKGPDYARAVLKDIRLKDVDPTAASGKGTFSGVLRLHGVEKSVNGLAEIRRAGSVVKVRASFPVVLKDFGIAEPRYLGVGVREQVTVQVGFDASMENAR